MIDFHKLFNEYAEKSKRVFAHDRSQTVGASEVFACVRQVYFKKTGEKEDADSEQSWGASSRGDLIENFYVVPALETTLPEDWDFIGAGEAQKTFIDQEARISATPDGMIAGLPFDALKLYGIDDMGSDCLVTEFKSIDPRVSLNEAKAIHTGQAIMQMGLIREQTEFKPNYAVILYFDASFLDKLSVFVVKFEPSVFENGKKRARSVFEAKAATELRAEGKLTNACNLCRFTSACAKASKTLMPTEQATAFDAEDLDFIGPLAKEYKELTASEKEIDERKKQVKAEITERLRKIGTKKITDGSQWSVSYSWSKGRSTVDFDAMRADGIDVESYKTEGDGHELMTVSLLKSKKNET